MAVNGQIRYLIRYKKDLSAKYLHLNATSQETGTKPKEFHDHVVFASCFFDGVYRYPRLHQDEEDATYFHGTTLKLGWTSGNNTPQQPGENQQCKISANFT